MRANGYGADLEFDGQTITIHPGKAAARASGTDTIRFPVGAVASVDYKAANPLVNGHVRFHLHDQSPATLMAYGGHPLAEGASTMSLSDASKGMVTAQSLVVHWRRKDNEAFAELHRQITAATGAH